MASLFESYDFQTDATYIAAVSGGSDSTALLLLLKSHLDRFHSGARLIAATVDHGLRAASADEARAVGKLCRNLGVQHQILNWSGDKPSRGIQAAARLARHRLLADFAVENSASAVFTGHTRDDQAETVLMRNARGNGRGSAGIAAATLHDGRIWFMRPLLSSRREQLRDHLLARGVDWADDPSNSDTRFERARLRNLLGNAPDRVAQMDEAVAMAADAAGLRMAHAHWAAGLLRLHAERVAPGLIRLEREALYGSHETIVAALRVLAALAGGADQLPDVSRVELLLQRLRGGSVRSNLSRALIDARKDAIFFLRENRGLPEEAPRPALVWDRRYAITAVGESRRVDSSRPGCAPDSLVRAALNTEPIMPDNCSKSPLVGPWAQFLPLFDLVLANEAARLVGAAAFCSPPLRGHIKKTT